MITVDLHLRFRAAVRCLYHLYNLLLVLTRRSYYAQRVYTGQLLFFPLPFTALPTLDLIVY